MYLLHENLQRVTLLDVNFIHILRELIRVERFVAFFVQAVLVVLGL